MNKSPIHNHHLARRWMTWRGLLALLTCLLSLSASAQQLKVEYYIDHDPGLGKAQTVSVTPDANGEINFTPPTDGLIPGNHVLGLRADVSADTTFRFAPTLRYDFFVPQEQQPGIVRVEYFWDTDPGLGQATPIDITFANELELNDIGIPTEGVPPGAHVLGLRARGTAGWGPTLHQDVYVPAGGASTGITLVEYFWDTDPGPGQGTPLVFTKQNDGTADINTDMPTDGLALGQHRLGFRAYSSAGWAPTVWNEVAVAPDPANIIVLRAEYFWDEDPGYGQGTPLTIAPGQTVSVDALGLSIDNLTPGEHQLFVRYHGVNGWSPTLFSDVLVPAGDVTIANAEYFWNEDPGFGKGTPIAITPCEEVTLEDVGIPSFTVHGDATLFIRYRGTQGWSPTVAYPIMVDAEGNYTLNANAETSMEQRNYQSLPDMMDDFADRGIGGSITLTVPTTQTEYSLDATDVARLAQIAKAAQDLENRSTPGNHQTLTFTATAGSGNTVAVTANDEDLPTVISLLAQTRLDNVALTVNGTAYDFTPATYRREELCSESETTTVGLSAISSAVRTTWQAQPHAGTVLSGFPTEGEGDLPSMTIKNSGNEADSLAYTVTLSDTNGRQLYSYLYYIKVHARVGHQSFANLTPATGSSLDPTVNRLAWSAIGDAVGGYRVVVTESAGGAEPTEIVNVVIDSLHYDVNVKSGYAYTWTVTAKGYCDELTSPMQTFTGRLLPDLVVTDIVLPEAAEAGNTIIVTATVRNSGEGATKETSWTDRLYYVIDSQDFAQAVQVATITHHGALDVDESYEASFTMKVPYLEAGNLRVFIETDATAAVMESNNDNNLTLSNTSATLQPFYMNTNDLAALRQLYADFDGANWTGSRWNIASELISENNWSGVTFDTEGQVTAINLQGRGLSGVLSASTAPLLPALTSLNLSHNALTGDVAPFVATLGLTSLNLSYNSIRDISAKLPISIHTLNVGNQNLTDVVDFNLSNMIDDDFLSQLPSIVRYDNNTGNYISDIRLRCDTGAGAGAFVLSRTNGETTVSTTSTIVYKGEYGSIIEVSSQSGLATGTRFLMKFMFPQGDATFNGMTDILDLQATINYMFNKWNGRLFNYAAVNLFPDEIINIQDAIRLVDVLINEPWQDQSIVHVLHAPHRVKHTDTPTRIYIEDNLLKLSTTKPVAALDIVLSDCDNLTDTGELTAAGLSYNTKQADSSLRLIAYSFNGGTLPVGETTLCRLEGENPQILHILMSDVEANEVRVDIESLTTGLSERTSSGVFRLYSTAGIMVANGDAKDMKSAIDHLPVGIYVLKLSYGNGKETQSKLRIESR